MSVAKVGKTKVSGNVVDYVFRKEKGVEKQPKIIGGNITGATKTEIKTEFREQEKLNSKVKNTVTHFSISFPVGQTIIDEDAADFADELIQSLGYDKNPYLVVRHFDKDFREVEPYAHIHIIASRIKSDGTLIPEWKIAEKAIEATKKIDKWFNFESVQYIKQNEAEKRERNIKKDEYQMMSKTGKLSVLEEFKDCAEVSLNKKRNVQKFVKDVQNGGFEVLPNISETTGEMNGFSFAKDGIIFTASRAGNQFKWANLSKSVDYQPAQDTKFLQELKAEVLAKIETEKHSKIETEAVKKVTKSVKNIEEVIEYEATRQRPIIGHSTDNSTPVEEKSNSQTQIIKVETPARIESDTGMAKTQIRRAVAPQIRNDRADDDATTSGKKVAGSNQTNFITTKRDAERDTSINAKSENGTDSYKERKDESASEHRTIEIEAVHNPASHRYSRTRTDKCDEQISRFSSVVEEYQNSDSKGLASSGHFDSRLSDRSERPTKGRNRSVTETDFADAKSDKLDSTTNSGSKGSSGFKGKSAGEDDSKIEIITEAFNRADDVVDSHNVVLFSNEQRPKGGTGSRENAYEGLKIIVGSGANGEGDNATKSRLYGHDTIANITRSREILQVAASQTVGNYSSDAEAHRRTAEKAAQVINVKCFSGQLDPQIVAKWTSIIENSDAGAFLEEIVIPKSLEE